MCVNVRAPDNSLPSPAPDGPAPALRLGYTPGVTGPAAPNSGGARRFRFGTRRDGDEMHNSPLRSPSREAGRDVLTSACSSTHTHAHTENTHTHTQNTHRTHTHTHTHTHTRTCTCMHSQHTYTHTANTLSSCLSVCLSVYCCVSQRSSISSCLSLFPISLSLFFPRSLAPLSVSFVLSLSLACLLFSLYLIVLHSLLLSLPLSLSTSLSLLSLSSLSLSQSVCDRHTVTHHTNRSVPVLHSMPTLPIALSQTMLTAPFLHSSLH